MTKTPSMYWKVDTPRLLEHYINTPDNAILLRPTQIFQRYLIKIATRVLELEDPVLMQMMQDLKLIEPISNKEIKDKG